MKRAIDTDITNDKKDVGRKTKKGGGKKSPTNAKAVAERKPHLTAKADRTLLPSIEKPPREQISEDPKGVASQPSSTVKQMCTSRGNDGPPLDRYFTLGFCCRICWISLFVCAAIGVVVCHRMEAKYIPTPTVEQLRWLSSEQVNETQHTAENRSLPELSTSGNGATQLPAFSEAPLASTTSSGTVTSLSTTQPQLTQQPESQPPKLDQVPTERAGERAMDNVSRHLPLSSIFGSDALPIFVTLSDLTKYPYAGLLAPCLARNQLDPRLPRRSNATCAVVGASPNLVGQGLGGEIDRHDLVFRAGLCTRNDMVPCQRDIGQKISYCISFWNAFWNEKTATAGNVIPMKSWRWLLEPEPKILQQNWFRCKYKVLLLHPEYLNRWDARMDAFTAQEPLPTRPAAAWRNDSIFRDTECNAKQQWTGKRNCSNVIDFSSGFNAVLLALELCKSVTVYGFDTNTSTSTEYKNLRGWVEDNRRQVRHHRHAFSLERHLIKLWNKTGILALHPSAGRVWNKQAQLTCRAQKRPAQMQSAQAAARNMPPPRPSAQGGVARALPSPRNGQRIGSDERPALRTRK